MGLETQVVMYTVPSRADSAIDTAIKMRDAGLPVDVTQVQTEQPSNRANCLNYTDAVKQADPTRPMLVIEDDITPADTLAEWIAYFEAERIDVPVILYAPFGRWHSSKAAASMADGGKDAPAGLEPLANLHVWWGSQAIWYPANYLAEFIASDKIRWRAYELTAFDVEFRRWLQAKGVTPLITTPHLVQHTGLPRVTGGASHHESKAFREGVKPPATLDAAVEQTGIKPKRVQTKEK